MFCGSSFIWFVAFNALRTATEIGMTNNMARAVTQPRRDVTKDRRDMYSHRSTDIKRYDKQRGAPKIYETGTSNGGKSLKVH